ncbi:sigma-70 family RNA polymerase sigma factor [Dactylosporangium fulvum]|uniref:Sigma-70 family RNA polymerase sigma factor n=1 Tax=Dactylosporangium fulvum TaxID=53359 RepID=A0ABY5VLZ6_9ACTN|nr:sigma-70 family RNA polymerase sigma factor [Dactylosporangium fulvum]UWP78637.1 sigma-70 family RNA polymerase sigma factor [Dactylosporangium fulvum]
MNVVEDSGAEWFRAVYARHYPDVVRYGLRRLATPGAAEELAQEVFLVVWRRRWEVPPKTLPWLYGVARRLLANHWRAERAGPQRVPLPDMATGDPHEQVAGLIDVRAALGRLSEDDQEILRLVAWEQLTVGEAAVVLGCGITAAKVRLHRARRRLAAKLSDRPEPATVPVRGGK